MKKIVVTRVVAMVAALSLTGACVHNGQEGGQGSPQMMGINPGGILLGAAGAAAGGFLGAQFGGGLGNMLFIMAGVAAGGSAGYSVGQRMMSSDWAMYDDTARNALGDSPDGEYRRWSNPGTGASGVIRPMRTFRAQTGEICRDYRATVAVSDLVQSGEGTACQGHDGDWYAMRDELS